MDKNKGNKGAEQMPKEKFDQQRTGFQPNQGGEKQGADKGQQQDKGQQKDGWHKAPAGGPRERSDEETIGRPVQLDREGGERGQSGDNKRGG